MIVMDSTYYKASGKFSPSVFISYLLIALISTPILALIYTHIIYYMPFIYFNVLITVGSAILLGFLTGKAINKGKCRNTLIASVLSIISVILMKYLTWAIYVPLVYTKSYEVLDMNLAERLQLSLYLLADPAYLLEGLSEIASIGVWSVFSVDFNGPLLYIVWVLEALIFIIGCCLMARSAAKEPYCEETNQWFKESKGEIKLNAPSDIQQFKADIEAGQMSDFIAMLSDTFADSDNYLSVKFYSLDDIDYGYMSVQDVTKTKDKKGKEKEDKNNIFEYIRVESNVLQSVKQPVSQ